MVTHAEKALICWAGVLVLFTASNARAQADGGDNNYESIITNRNIFALRPAPVVSSEPNKPPPPPVPKVWLTGITTILGEPLALLKWTPPAVPGNKEQAKERSCTLSVGQREDDVEVKTIDIAKGMVQIDDYGVVTNLTFEKDAPKGSSGGAGGTPPPPGHNMPTQSPFTPGVRPGGLQRTVRMPSLPGSSGPPHGGVSMGGATATPASYNSGGGPSMNIGGNALSLTGGSPQSGQPITLGQPETDLESSALMLEAQRIATEQEVTSGKMGPLPVTSMTPPGSPGSLETPTENTPGTLPGTTASPTLPIPGRPFRPY
jgi:hypothetical protein